MRGSPYRPLANLPPHLCLFLCSDHLWGRLATCRRLLIGVPLASETLFSFGTRAYVGRVGRVTAWPIGNRPTAGPPKLLRSGDEARRHRIHFYILNGLAKFLTVPHQPVETLILPKGFASQAENLVRLSSRKSFQRLHHFADSDGWCDQKMHVIRHHDVGMQFILSILAKMNGIHHNARNLWNPKIKRSRTDVIENPVHRHERLARSSRWRKASLCRKAALQHPCEKYRSADGMEVRESPASKGSHLERVPALGKILRQAQRPVANQPSRSGEPQPSLKRGFLTLGARRLPIGGRLPTCPTKNSSSMRSSTGIAAPSTPPMERTS